MIPHFENGIKIGSRWHKPFLNLMWNGDFRLFWHAIRHIFLKLLWWPYTCSKLWNRDSGAFKSRCYKACFGRSCKDLRIGCNYWKKEIFSKLQMFSTIDLYFGIRIFILICFVHNITSKNDKKLILKLAKASNFDLLFSLFTS